MGIKRTGSTRYASRSNSGDKFRKILARIDDNFRIHHQTKPNIRTKRQQNMQTWRKLGVFDNTEEK